MWECLFQWDYLIVDLIRWCYKGRKEAIKKMWRETSLPSNLMETRTRNKTWSLTLTDKLSEKCIQTRIL